MKRCSRCKEKKELSLFVKDKSSSDGVARVCKKCKMDFYFENKDSINKKRKEYRDTNKKAISERRKNYRKTKRGKLMLTLTHINQRCNNKNSDRYHRYGGRGITSSLTYDDLDYLWERDNAKDMKQPSIDRIDNNGNYELSNCQFIEWSHNASKDVPKQSVDQIDMNGRLVNRWVSMAEAARSGFHAQNIVKCCKGHRRTHGGFRWEYADK